VKLKFKTLDLQSVNAWTIARTQSTTTFKVVVLELNDGDTLNAIGEAAPVSRYNESAESVELFLHQLDTNLISFDDVPGSTAYVESLSSGDFAAKCAVNIALLDGAAQRAGKPIHEFLGLDFLEHHHVTSFTIGIDTPDVIRRKVLAADSYPILKLKAGVTSDRAVLQALRDVAPTKTVRVDANEGWRTKEEALEMIEWLAQDGHVEFVEQPMPASVSVKDWTWLKQRSPLPIFGDESYHFAGDADRAAECFHGVNVKLVKTGGIGPAHDALLAARKRGLKTMLGCMLETSVLISAAAHLAALCDYLDLDGNLLIANDPYIGVSARKGVLSFADTPQEFGLRVCAKERLSKKK
jgi:L-Ala-D/L-Glu epimerase / N-acetyl-D-glutamate racemase